MIKQNNYKISIIFFFAFYSPTHPLKHPTNKFHRSAVLLPFSQQKCVLSFSFPPSVSPHLFPSIFLPVASMVGNLMDWRVLGEMPGGGVPIWAVIDDAILGEAFEEGNWTGLCPHPNQTKLTDWLIIPFTAFGGARPSTEAANAFVEGTKRKATTIFGWMDGQKGIKKGHRQIHFCTFLNHPK